MHTKKKNEKYIGFGNVRDKTFFLQIILTQNRSKFELIDTFAQN